jgi:hypothetical protein
MGMSQLTHAEARARRLRAGRKLIDIAIAAKCAPATVRAYEFGAPVRAEIHERLVEAYEQLEDTS